MAASGYHGTLEGRTECDIISEIIVSRGIEESKMIREDKSTNCGDNAKLTLSLLRTMGIVCLRGLVVVQDPTMQSRTHLGFLKHLGADPWPVYSSAPTNVPDPSLWGSEARMFELLLGEVPRLIDYGGPKMGGKGLQFIEDCDIPAEVMAAYITLKQLLPTCTDRSNL
jgi:uncharacterized SAM-binding protein YcdF (DUF218 family)